MTFVLTLLIPLQFAVLVGVGLSIVLHVAGQSNRVLVRRWVFHEGDARPTEVDPPVVLASGEIVVLTTYGSLFFASAPNVERQLPEVPPDAQGAAVILRLRGKDDIGSTFIRILLAYTRRLEAAGAALYLSSVGPALMGQLTSTGALAIIGADRVFAAQKRVGDTVFLAIEAAHARAAAAGVAPIDDEGSRDPEPGTGSAQA